MVGQGQSVYAKWATRFRSYADQVQLDLLKEPGRTVLLHRDFYDKQVFVTHEDTVGLLDFDTLTTGEAALDLANALVHFELRALLGQHATNTAHGVIAAMLDGYRSEGETWRRLGAHAAASRLRLLCVYAFRPIGRQSLPELYDWIQKARVLHVPFL